MTSPTVTTTKEDDLIAAADTAARVVGTILVAFSRSGSSGQARCGELYHRADS